MTDQNTQVLSSYNYNNFQFNPRAISFVQPHRRKDNEDSARLLLRPNKEFRVPFLANPPHGSAFVWWTGIQGFDLNGNPTLSIHHYIGQKDVDVDVVFPDEFHIVLNGTFLGKTAIHDATWLRGVITEPTPSDGKILILPGLLKDVARVKVENYRFSHDGADETDSIAYEISFIRVRIGGIIKLPKLDHPVINGLRGGKKRKNKGKSKRYVVATASHRTIKKLAYLAYGKDTGGPVRLIRKNEKLIAKFHIPRPKLMNYQFPIGTRFAV